MQYCDTNAPFNQQRFSHLVDTLVDRMSSFISARFFKPKVEDPIVRREVMANQMRQEHRRAKVTKKRQQYQARQTQYKQQPGKASNSGSKNNSPRVLPRQPKRYEEKTKSAHSKINTQDGKDSSTSQGQRFKYVPKQQSNNPSNHSMRQEVYNNSNASKQSAKPSNNSMTSNSHRTVGGATAHNDRFKHQPKHPQYQRVVFNGEEDGATVSKSSKNWQDVEEDGHEYKEY